MKLVCIAAFGLVAAVMPSYSLTNVSTCGTYSANDKYVVQADISSSSTTVACLNFTGISATANGIDIDLNGHNVVSTAYHALDINTCVSNIYIHDSVGTGSFRGKVGWDGVSGPGVTSSISIRDSATMSGGWILISGIRAYGEIRAQSSNKTTFPMKSLRAEYNHIYNGLWTLVGVDNAYLTGEYIDNRGDNTISTNGANVIDCDSPRLEYITVIGGPGIHSPSPYTGNTDDAVVFGCSTTCSGGVVDHITAYDMYDCLFEWVSSISNAHITNNTGYRTNVAGIGGFGVYNASMSSSEIKNNVIKGSTRLFFIFPPAGAPSGTFSNNTISGNKIDSSNISTIGDISGGAWAASTGNVLANNDFGAGSTLQLSTTGGTDGGGNHCAATSPNSTFITCQ
jgi:hypothetical protein